ncbi:MAG TPA: DUF5134 domain-containing protein [Ktedonobacteraceae bacterium]|jgi:hypothetical protein
MIDTSLLHVIFLVLCSFIAVFYLFLLVSRERRESQCDREHEVGQSLMALGMLLMLVPTNILNPSLLHWNVAVFALASSWWLLRLFLRRPLLAALRRTAGLQPSLQADAMHMLMHGGMCYQCVLMSSMALSMTQPAVAASGAFFISFVFLALFYGWKLSRGLQRVRLDWRQCGANLAHALMSAMMSWMFLEMILMALRMTPLTSLLL